MVVAIDGVIIPTPKRVTPTQAERYLRQGTSHLDQAMDILRDQTIQTVEVQSVKAAATQAMQAAMELNRLVGLMTAGDK